MTTIFIDMDGVVADWDRAATEFLKQPRPVAVANQPEERWPLELWQQLRTHERFYATLPKVKDADRLMNLAREFRDQLGYNLLFLTAIPKDNDMPWAFWDKMMWAQENYPDVAVHFGPYSLDKQDHCEYGDILVDDRADNCQRWEEAGGTAVRVTASAYDQTLMRLMEILDSRRSRSE
jgi:hypothetical protein